MQHIVKLSRTQRITKLSHTQRNGKLSRTQRACLGHRLKCPIFCELPFMQPSKSYTTGPLSAVAHCNSAHFVSCTGR